MFKASYEGVGESRSVQQEHENFFDPQDHHNKIHQEGHVPNELVIARIYANLYSAHCKYEPGWVFSLVERFQQDKLVGGLRFDGLHIGMLSGRLCRQHREVERHKLVGRYRLSGHRTATLRIGLVSLILVHLQSISKHVMLCSVGNSKIGE